MSENIQLPNQVFPTTHGEVNLAEVDNEWLIIYFYPKDSTPGCTTQAVGFSCLKDQFDVLGARILSITRLGKSPPKLYRKAGTDNRFN